MSNDIKKEAAQADTTPKVTGIGGIFFFSKNPVKTKEWYSKHLGLEVNECGLSLIFFGYCILRVR